jgi:hypothetical protein
MDCNIFYKSQNITNGISIALANYSGAITSVLYGVNIFGVSATTTNSGNSFIMLTKISSTAVTTANVTNNLKLYANINIGNSDTIIIPQYSSEVSIPNTLNNTFIIRSSFCNVNKK